MKSMDPENRSNHLKTIEKKFEKCKEFSDEKVQLANQTYEMVRIDKYCLFAEPEQKPDNLIQGR
jgi:hypothetical protein